MEPDSPAVVYEELLEELDATYGRVKHLVAKAYALFLELRAEHKKIREYRISLNLLRPRE